MNSKIKNYVDVLFKDIPHTKKAQELKEEILSNLNDHFEEHISKGKSENQAYTLALGDLGDIDELLKELEPEAELKTKIDSYRKKRARNTSISVVLYVFGIISLIGLAGIADITNFANVEFMGIIGLVLLLAFSAVATGIIIYTNMSIPQDVEQYITQSKKNYNINYQGDSKALRFLNAFMKVYWVLVLIIYLSVSFSIGKSWLWSWIIWVIAAAVKEALFIFFDANNEKEL